MTLSWRCVDCGKGSSFIAPDNTPVPIQDAYDEIMNQHVAGLLQKGQIYMRGVSPPSPLDDVIVIYMLMPHPATLQCENSRLTLQVPDHAKWPNPTFEVRHVR